MHMLLLALTLGAPPVHIGSPVVMVRYKQGVEGEKRAAVVIKGPFVCPEGTPHAGETCANLGFFMAGPGDQENSDPVHCAPNETCMVNPAGLGVATGYDRRENVYYDPTGATERSWHVWGEAEGEELQPAVEPRLSDDREGDHEQGDRCRAALPHRPSPARRSKSSSE